MSTQSNNIPEASFTNNFVWAKHNDYTVHNMLRANKCHTEIIGELAKEKEQLLSRIMELESIAPKKITMPDGSVMTYHCPDNLVPNAQNEKSAPSFGLVAIMEKLSNFGTVRLMIGVKKRICQLTYYVPATPFPSKRQHVGTMNEIFAATMKDITPNEHKKNLQ